MPSKTYRKVETTTAEHEAITAEQFLPNIGQIPKGVYADGLGDPSKRTSDDWVLNTAKGKCAVRGGDYICTGPRGERWRVAKGVFEATYEEVAESA